MKKLYYLSLALVKWDYLKIPDPLPPTNSLGFMAVFENLDDLQKQFPGYSHVEITLEEPEKTPLHLN